MLLIAHMEDCAIVLLGPTYDGHLPVDMSTPMGMHMPSVKMATVCSCGGVKVELRLPEKCGVPA